MPRYDVIGDFVTDRQSGHEGELKDMIAGTLAFVLAMFAMIGLLIAFPKMALRRPLLFY